MDLLRKRHARLRDVLGDEGVDAAVVSPGTDLRYLLGTTHPSFERLTGLVVGAGAPVLVVPLMDADTWRGAVPEADLEVVPWADGEDGYAVMVEVLGRVDRVAVSADLAARHLLGLQRATAGRTAFLADVAVERLRRIKDDDEVAQLRGAGAAIDAVHAVVPDLLRPGRSEIDVATDIAALMSEQGFTRAEFIAVASGPNGAHPHHSAGPRVMERHDLVFVDLSGPWHGGYFADSTRVYALGEPAADAAAAAAALVGAMTAAVAAIRPGVRAADVDRAARDVLLAEGLADRFLHRTGHGIGLDVHEAPDIGPGNDEVLEAGMAFSVEPGLYLPGAFGARVEDIVVVTEDGCERLNERPRELLVV